MAVNTPPNHFGQPNIYQTVAAGSGVIAIAAIGMESSHPFVHMVATGVLITTAADTLNHYTILRREPTYYRVHIKNNLITSIVCAIHNAPYLCRKVFLISTCAYAKIPFFDWKALSVPLATRHIAPIFLGTALCETLAGWAQGEQALQNVPRQLEDDPRLTNNPHRILGNERTVSALACRVQQQITWMTSMSLSVMASVAILVARPILSWWNEP